MTCGPLRGKTLSVSPCEGEDLVPEVERTPSPCVSPPKAFGGEQEGSSDAESLSVKGSRPAIDPSAPRKARKWDRGSDEAANPGRVLFLVYVPETQGESP